MSSQNARVFSIEVLRAQQANLLRFTAEVEAALVAMELQGRRPVEWVITDRGSYWPREVRRAQDAICEARVALERCELSSRADERRYCYDERKALEAAKRRLRYAEEQVHRTRLWRIRIQKAADQFQAQIARLRDYLDNELPRAVAELDRMAGALERYVQVSPPATPNTPAATSATEGNTP